jgi:hypothetical protein
MMEKVNLLGAFTALGYFSSMILIFVLRLVGKTEVGRWLGLGQTLVGIPLVGYLLFTSRGLERSQLYIIQTGLMLVFLLVELLIDYIWKLDFRQVRWMVIVYVTFFFAATGGMIGVAGYGGPGWLIAAVILYLVMAVLAFIQRRVTGL